MTTHRIFVENGKINLYKAGKINWWKEICNKNYDFWTLVGSFDSYEECDKWAYAHGLVNRDIMDELSMY